MLELSEPPREAYYIPVNMKTSTKSILASTVLALLMMGAPVTPAAADTYSTPAMESTSSSYTSTGEASSSGQRKDMDAFSIVMFVIIGSIAFTAWGSLPYMIWVLRKEKLRRYEPISVPEGSPEYSHDPASLSPVCGPILKWQQALSTREVEGIALPVITSRVELDKGYELLELLKTQKGRLNSDSIHFANTLGEELNAAQTRYFNGSKVGLFIASAFFAFMALGMFSAGAYVPALCWLAFIGIYFLSMKSPVYKLANPAPGYYRVWKVIVKGLGIGSLFVAADLADGKYAPVYREVSTGKLFQFKDDRDAGCFMCMLVLVFVFVFAPFIFLLNAICDFVRNYIGKK